MDVRIWPHGRCLPADVVSVSHDYLHTLATRSRAISAAPAQVEQELHIAICAICILQIQEVLFVKFKFCCNHFGEITDLDTRTEDTRLILGWHQASCGKAWLGREGYGWLADSVSDSQQIAVAAIQARTAEYDDNIYLTEYIVRDRMFRKIAK